MEQSFLHTHCSTVSLTSFRTGAVPDRQSPGSVSHQSGDYRTTNLPTPRNHPTTFDIRLLDIPEPLSLHIHSQLRVNKYVRAFTVRSTCPGFHRTAVLFLSELYTDRYPMDLPNYPLNTIPNTCISNQTTRFTG